MASTAILIGNANYQSQPDLSCCCDDVAAMLELVKATGRFDQIHHRVDVDADVMRDVVREALPVGAEQSEVFFYFSGHGAQIDGEFYYCGTGFDRKRPNETGVSHSELHGLFRAASPSVLIVVIDACQSGTLLVKREDQPPPLIKEGFRSVLQFSSSMSDQDSFGGQPLSEYTRAFIEASTRKTDGAVYYSDISNALRDIFIDNDKQTPYFVSQGTGRETLVDDATKLDDIRKQFAARFRTSDAEIEDEGGHELDGERDNLVLAGPPPAKQLLIAAEEKMGSPEEAKELIDKLFDGLLAAINQAEFAEFFETAVVEHTGYDEPTIKEFMIRVLSREKRSDRLVTAEIKREHKRGNPFDLINAGVLDALGQVWTTLLTLELNCTLERAQLTVKLTPKYRSLQRLVLVVSCAPSLEHCYVFEMVTQHLRIDWNAFSHEGEDVVKRWYKLDWDSDTSSLVEKICDGLTTAVRTHLEQTTRRLAGD